MTTTPQKITFGEKRESGVHDVLIYCRDHRCSHQEIRQARLCPAVGHRPGFVFTRCGKRGAEVRPKFSQARMGAG
jgi:hypothetical protein